MLAREILPSQFAALDAARLAGLCTAGGGPTSHVAIMASAIGLPMLVAAGDAIDTVPEGREVILDAVAGELHVAPERQALAAAERACAQEREHREAQRVAAAREGRTRDGRRIHVYANLGSPAEAAAAVGLGAEGCGLLRTEFLFLGRRTPPSEDEQLEVYQQIARHLDGRPLTVRTLDAGGDKPIDYLPLPMEENPALGLRGVRTSLWRPELLRAQLRAILQVQPRGQCRILLPMVTDVSDIAAVRTELDAARASLGVDAAAPALGVMIETPAAAMLADTLATQVDFFSVGTNDLTQYTLAMDRGHPELASRLDGLHPAVLRLIDKAARAARAQGREFAVCGNLGIDPQALPILVGLGVQELSVAACGGAGRKGAPCGTRLRGLSHIGRACARLCDSLAGACPGDVIMKFHLRLDAAQRLGRALMLPIAVLPVAGLMLRLGQPDLLDIAWMATAGQAIFSNLGLLFAIGVAVGFARENHGAAGLAAVVGYVVTTKGAEVLLAVPPEALAGFEGAARDLAAAGWKAREIAKLSVPVGILSGLIAGALYNRYSDIELPDYLAFFGGRRFVPIASGFAGLLLAAAFGYGWPVLEQGMDAASRAVVAAGGAGLFVYGLLNRLLIVTGLHHILNNIAWFILGDYGGATGDLNRFFAGDPTAGRFMSGFFPVMMFGLPGACLAMYSTARPERRRVVGGLLLSMALTSFLTGVTEPIEFAFMFLAPVLYAVHAVLTGTAMWLMHWLDVRLGFGFSAGLFDYVLNFRLAEKPLWLLPIGAAYFALYFGLFRWAILRFDLRTPGREPIEPRPRSRPAVFQQRPASRHPRRMILCPPSVDPAISAPSMPAPRACDSRS